MRQMSIREPCPCIPGPAALPAIREAMKSSRRCTQIDADELQRKLKQTQNSLGWI